MPNLEILNDKKIKEEINQNENENEIDNEDNNNNIYQNNIDKNINKIENKQNIGNENNEQENENNENEEENDNDNVNIIDINDEEIKNISLQDEIPNFININKKISQKFKSIQKNNNFKDELESLIKNEIDKINSNSDNNIPNYIYSTNVIESKLCIYSFFINKFLEFLSTQEEKDTYELIKEVHENISKSNLLLIKIIYKLYPIVEEKIQMLKTQLDEAIKNNNNILLELNENENKIKQEIKNKEKLVNTYEEKINYLESKIKQLENENNLMSEKLFSSVKNVINNDKQNSINHFQNDNNNPNKNAKSNINYNNNYNNNIIENNTKYDRQKQFQDNISNNSINNYGNLYPPQNNYNSINSNILNNNSNSNNNILNNSFNNNSLLQASPVCNRVFTIKMMKEIINDIYQSKAEFDKKSDENKLPRETLEQHMYTYLNQKYGLKSIIIEWASNIINGIKIFSSEDSEVCLFGKILRNEIEEDARLIYSRLQQSILEYLKYYFKSKHPYKSTKDINNLLKEKKKNKMLNEDEWKKIINYLYNSEDAKILEEKINDVIQKKFYKSRLDTDRKLTRNEIIQLSKKKDE